MKKIFLSLLLVLLGCFVAFAQRQEVTSKTAPNKTEQRQSMTNNSNNSGKKKSSTTAKTQNQPSLTPSEMAAKGHAAYANRNYGEALNWYRKAADQGDAWAQFRLGWMYYSAQGVSQDYSEAARWYRRCRCTV